MANDGDLTCFDLLVIEGRLATIWPDNTFDAARRVVKDDSVQALIRKMTADFEMISTQTSKKTPGMKVNWIEDCPVAVKTCAVDCNAPSDGIEFGANCVTIDIDQCTQAVNLSIDDSDLWTTETTFEELVPKAMFRADQTIAEKLNVDSINAVDAAATAATNQNPDVSGGQIVPGIAACTTMTAAIWADPLQYLSTTMELNNYTNAYFLSGGGSSFFQTVSRDQKELGLGPVLSGLTVWNQIDTFFDIRQLDTTLTPDKKLFMINTGEFAVLNAYRYPTLDEAKFEPGRGGSFIKYRSRSPILSQFYKRDWYHDVVYTIKCKALDNTLFKFHTWEILTRYKIAQAPGDCDGNGRVLCFECSA